MVSSHSSGLTGNNNNNNNSNNSNNNNDRIYEQHDILSPSESSSCPSSIAQTASLSSPSPSSSSSASSSSSSSSSSAEIELRVNDKDAISFGANDKEDNNISSRILEKDNSRGKELSKSQSGPSSLQSTSNYGANFHVEHLISDNSRDSRESSIIVDDKVGSEDNLIEGNETNDYHESEENYEGFGFGQSGELEESLAAGSCGGGGGAGSVSSSAPSPTGPNSLSLPSSTIGRHSWLRTSLRRTPPSTGSRQRQLGSNALASQLYRSGSFNSSGRGSTCDAADDMYSDVSLEDDVIDLNHRVRMIQEQMHVLTDTHSVGEERYARAKQENATLQARILMLEEAAKDAEARAEEKLEMEQRRHREWACRLEREKQLQLENYGIKMQTIELESASLRDQIGRLREQLESTREDRARLDNVIHELRREIADVREAERNALLRANEARVLLDAAKEELAVRADDRLKIDELLQEIEKLRERNKALEESRDELQAAAALHAGRELLMLNLPRPGYDTINVNGVDDTDANGANGALPSGGACSLAVELSGDVRNSISRVAKQPLTMAEMRQALKEQQEVNTQLRSYIDGILLNIVENYPQLLEVKQQSNGGGCC